MSANYWDRERAYRKRIAIILSGVVGVMVAALMLSGRGSPNPIARISQMVGWHGPMELLPEVSIEPDVSTPHVSTAPAAPRTAEAIPAEPARGSGPATEMPDLTPNPPRPSTLAAQRVDEPEPATRAARPEVSYSDTYVILHMVKPRYPLHELTDGVEGNVAVELLVDESGHVAQANVVSLVGPQSFQDSALDAVRQFLFQPPMQNGRPTTMWVKFLIKYRIQA